MTHYRQRVDASPLLTLAVCSCGWREASWDRLDARQRIRDHVLAVHPGNSDNARSALNKYRRRTA
jgi:hypothetical protein